MSLTGAIAGRVLTENLRVTRGRPHARGHLEVHRVDRDHLDPDQQVVGIGKRYRQVQIDEGLVLRSRQRLILGNGFHLVLLGMDGVLSIKPVVQIISAGIDDDPSDPYDAASLRVSGGEKLGKTA
jgi:hypothetical protein